MEVDLLVDVQPLQPREDGAFGRGVDRSRLVTTGPLADHRLPLHTGRHAREDPAQVLDRATADLEPGLHGSRGWKSRPETSLG